jgi:hypothetical protein
MWVIFEILESVNDHSARKLNNKNTGADGFFLTNDARVFGIY